MGMALRSALGLGSDGTFLVAAITYLILILVVDGSDDDFSPPLPLSPSLHFSLFFLPAPLEQICLNLSKLYSARTTS